MRNLATRALKSRIVFGDGGDDVEIVHARDASQGHASRRLGAVSSALVAAVSKLSIDPSASGTTVPRRGSASVTNRLVTDAGARVRTEPTGAQVIIECVW